ncbi:OprO/OprP family phosphate-selective porin [Abyssalbus ytuae]|uniref:OprO/OprP family phosphate-selective porin n=1 Tax=Abyssalbus ytuae TaxID=2926907 RepID=A0A9E6ZZ14_9FLAO|nr:OprO/OprP family phosphate-selective porin [Abyssalbus ytuae]UOB16476.1 OprO/OprP family phosphate-selective porin [Abyssalbus ytuae]
MKFYKIFLWACLLLIFSRSHSQNVRLNSYQFGEGLQFSTTDGKELKISGFIQPYFETKHYTDADDLDAANRFRMRRARLRFDGESANKRFSYRFQVDLSGASEADDGDTNYLMDAYISYELTNRIKVSFGQRSTYTDNRELFMSSNTLQLVERSRLTSAFASIREFGLFLQGNFRSGGGSYLRPYFVLTNGDGGNVFGKDHGGLKVGGRIDFLPFGLFTNFGQFRQADVMRERSPKLAIGVNYSHNNGMSSRRGRGSGDIIYLNDNDEESLPDYTKYGIDFLFKYNGFSALGEYVKTSATVPSDITKRILNSGSISTSFEVDGEQDVENYVKGRMMLGEGYNLQLGYLFKSGYSVDARYTHLKADTNSFLNNDTFYSRPNYYTIGLSKYLARNYGAKIQTSFTYVDGDSINDNGGNPIDGNEWIARLMLTFSF